MPQLDLITLLDQFVITYFTFIFLHFLFALGPVPRIFSVFAARHFLFNHLTDKTVGSQRIVEQYSQWDREQDIRFRKLLDSVFVE
jgi:hypothetical protein